MSRYPGCGPRGELLLIRDVTGGEGNPEVKPGIKSHPGMSKPHYKPRGDESCRSPPVSISGDRMDGISHLEINSGFQLLGRKNSFRHIG